MRILLDSNAYSEFMSGNHRDREIVQGAEEILMSAVVVGQSSYTASGRVGATSRISPSSARFSNDPT